MAVISLKLVYKRITLNKISLAFFLFSVIHFFTQVILQSFLYSLDLDNRTLATSVIHEAEVPRREIAWLNGNSKEFTLQLCTDIPFGMTNKFCTTIFDSRHGNLSVPIPAGARRSDDDIPDPSSIVQQMTATAEPSFNSSGQRDGVNMSMDNGTTVFLSDQCTRLFLYPQQIFKDFVREDGVLVALQFWLLCTSFVVIIYESRPHLIAAFVTRVIVTIWSAYSTWRSGHIANYISHLITSPNSPCGVNVFPTYFRTRVAYEISILAVSSVGLLVFIYFFTKLFKMFDAQTLKNIGPTKEIIQIHRFFLGFCVCLQLSVFFLVTAMSLWINELMNGAIALISTSSGVYHAIFITSTTLLLPWIMMGWFAARREMKMLMAAFFILAVFYIASWAVMFYYLVFRWTFISWPFFASLTVTAFVEIFLSCVFGVICWRNFDKGLAHYLYVEDTLSKANFQPGVFINNEKDSGRPSFDSMRMLTVEGTKHMVAANAVRV